MRRQAIGSEVNAGRGPDSNRFGSRWITLTLVLLAMPTLPLRAQPCEARPISIPHPITSLLRAPSVHQELNLGTTQISAITAEVEQVDLPLWRMRDACRAQCGDDAAQLISRLRTRAAEILSASQSERLDQIVWQSLGVDAVLDRDLAASLKLTAEQQNNVRAFLNVGYKKLAELKRSASLYSEGAQAVRLQRLHTETQQNIDAVLSPSQLQAFKELMGPRFDFSPVRSIACKAPELNATNWIESTPVKLSELKGNVAVVHFYAFGCGNCVRTLPYLNDWHKRFSPEGLRIVGVHRPETERERDVDRVREKAAEAQMAYPIAIDNDSLTWDAWANRVWPSIYLIDRDGCIRYWWYGELNWQGNESEVFLRSKIRELLRESRSPELVLAGS